MVGNGCWKYYFISLIMNYRNMKIRYYLHLDHMMFLVEVLYSRDIVRSFALFVGSRAVNDEQILYLCVNIPLCSLVLVTFLSVTFQTHWS